MKPAQITPHHAVYWRDLDPEPARFTGNGTTVADVDGLVTKSTPDDPEAPPGPASPHNVARIPFQPSEEERVLLAAGGTIWLSLWSKVPPHMLEVQPAPGDGN